jgi:hypothetical protein
MNSALKIFVDSLHRNGSEVANFVYVGCYLLCSFMRALNATIEADERSGQMAAMPKKVTHMKLLTMSEVFVCE